MTPALLELMQIPSAVPAGKIVFFSSSRSDVWWIANISLILQWNSGSPCAVRWLTRVQINKWKQSYSKSDLQQGASGQEIEGGGLQQSGSIFCWRGVLLVLFSLLDIYFSGSWFTWWKSGVFQQRLYDRWRKASQSQKISFPVSARGCKRRSIEVKFWAFIKSIIK